MICFYSTFLLFNAMQADPDNGQDHESCNLFHRARDGLSLWIGFLITFASLFYAALRSDMVAILGKDPEFVGAQEDHVVDLLTKEDKMAIPMKEEDPENLSINDSNYNDVDDTSTVKLIED